MSDDGSESLLEVCFRAWAVSVRLSEEFLDRSGRNEKVVDGLEKVALECQCVRT